MITSHLPLKRPQHYQISSLRLLLLALLLSGCQAAMPRAPASALPVEPAPPLPNAPVYVVDPAASQARILVWRDGPLSRLGHNHVLIAPVSGKVHAGDAAARSGFAMSIDVAAIKVDPPAARGEEGEAFAGEISGEDRRGTRENLLGAEVLDAGNHPRIEMRSVSLSGPRWNPDVVAQLTLRGVTRVIAFPAAVFVQGETITVIARFTILQSAFGIEPFSVFGGSLRVRDAIDVRVKVVAKRK